MYHILTSEILFNSQMTIRGMIIWKVSSTEKKVKKKLGMLLYLSVYLLKKIMTNI